MCWCCDCSESDDVAAGARLVWQVHHQPCWVIAEVVHAGVASADRFDAVLGDEGDGRSMLGEIALAFRRDGFISHQGFLLLQLPGQGRRVPELGLGGSSFHSFTSYMEGGGWSPSTKAFR